MAKKKSTFWSDFKAFMTRGNILDMAVGVVIGGAFGKIVTSLVNDIIMPPIGVLIGGVDFADLKVTIKAAEVVDEEMVKEAVTLNYGSFIQTILEFLIIAFCIFLILRIMVKAQKKLNAKKIAEEEAKAAEEAAKAEAEKKAAEEAAAALAKRQAELEESALEQAKILAEIRDLIKNK